MIDPAKRQRYDYDNIQRLYIDYNHTKIDDSDAIEQLKGVLSNRNILLLLPGHSILEYKKRNREVHS